MLYPTNIFNWQLKREQKYKGERVNKLSGYYRAEKNNPSTMSGVNQLKLG